MGNAAGKLTPCFCPATAAGDLSRRHDIAVVLSSAPLDDGLGHSFCYIRPPEPLAGDDKLAGASGASPLPTISGASVSANASTPLSTALFDPFFPISTSLDRAASFESTPSFAAVPLQPIPRHLINSGPLLRSAGSILGSGPIERGFLSGPIERGFMSGPIPLEPDLPSSGKSRNKKWSAIRDIKDSIMEAVWGPKTTSHKKMINQNDSVGRTTVTSSGSNLSSLCDENGEGSLSSDQWAQGKAGEDRVHVVVSDEHGWVFVGIYDGFNGPDATDFLLSNLYAAVHKELKGILWNDDTTAAGVSPRCEASPEKSGCRKWKKKKSGKVGCSSDRHSAVLGAMAAALGRTEAAYLDIADEMIVENPVLSLMGSCVLVMLMAGDDVYLMNVGDSRAVLGRRSETECSSSSIRSEDGYDDLPCVSSVQLTVDHNTLVKEEVERIMNEHPDDQCAITNERVKGSLKVTRAFGAGFLKNPKWNKGLLEMFRIDYVGRAPYITCSPSLHHHQLGPKDKFLILSSDGLYQYFTNEEATAAVELFMMLTPEGDPAQHLVEEVLFRTAKKAGMDFHELLDIPQGERRRYHDDVSIIIISFEGRIWRSSV